MLRASTIWLVVSTASLMLSGGCYDSAALVKQVRNDSLRNQSHEIDLGQFRTTIPRDSATNTIIEIELQLFGTVPQYRIPAIEKQLKADGYHLRAETLVAIRQTTDEELAEANLGTLRARLKQVVNSVLKNAPIKSIGIEQILIVEK